MWCGELRREEKSMTYKLPTKWSPQQTTFIDWCDSGAGNAVLEAVAGSGKTTTLLAGAIKMAKRGKKVAICAYNKKIADEIRGKLEDLGIEWKQVRAGTMHSFGFNAIRKTFGEVQVDEKKCDTLFAEMQPNHPWHSVIVRLVSMAKQQAFGAIGRINDFTAWRNIIDHFEMVDESLTEEQEEEIILQAIALLKKSNGMTQIVDFDDMVYLPLIHPCRFFRYDVVIIDEAQDTNPARRELAKKLLAPRGRLIAVGDPCQAIYGFTGADNDSLDIIAREFSCQRLPLTVTYRCPKKVVEFARQWVSHIEAHADNAEGEIRSLAFADFIKSPQEGAILCRTTKHLVSAAFALIRAKIACRIEGRDIGKGLVKLAQKWQKVKTIDAFDARLEKFLENTRKNMADRPKKLELIEEQAATLRVIMEECRRQQKTQMADVVDFVTELFADNVQEKIVLSTIHKAKGREWNHVFWLNRASTCPSPYATQAWMRQQEANLQYVAATRAMMTLTDMVM
jgi:superfamily I DNA/RNA helicase